MSKPIQNPELKKPSEQKRNAVVKTISMPRDFASEISRLTQNVPGGFSRFIVQAIAEKFSKSSDLSTSILKLENFNDNEQITWDTIKKFQDPNSTILSPNNQGSKETNSAPGAFSMPLLLKAPQNI